MSFGIPNNPLLPNERRRKPISSTTRRRLLTTPRKCMWCKKVKAQEIHHIDENPSNNKQSNLIPLCGTCHNRVTAGEISREQLRKRKGVKPTKTRAPTKKRSKRRTKTPMERMAERIRKQYSF